MNSVSLVTAGYWEIRTLNERHVGFLPAYQIPHMLMNHKSRVRKIGRTVVDVERMIELWAGLGVSWFIRVLSFGVRISLGARRHRLSSSVSWFTRVLSFGVKIVFRGSQAPIVQRPVR